MKKSFIQLLCVLCLVLVGCDQIQNVKSKIFDSLHVGSKAAHKADKTPLQQREPTPLEVFKEHKRLHDAGDFSHSYDAAIILLEGKVVPKNVELALKVLETSMYSNEDSKFHLFSYWIDSSKQDRFALIFEVLSKDLHSKKAHPMRYNLLAQVYEHSIGTEKNIQKAVDFHKKAQELGNEDSIVWLKNHKQIKKTQKELQEKELQEKKEAEEKLRLDKQREPTPLEVFKEHKRLHDAGDFSHSYDAAIMLLEGKVVPKNVESALKILETSMYSNEDSKFHLFSYWIDSSKQDRFALIFEVLSKDLHSKKAHPMRYNLLAQVYEHSIGTEKNIQKAVDFHKKAQELGNEDSLVWLKNHQRIIKTQKELQEKELQEKELQEKKEAEEKLRLEKLELEAALEKKVRQEREAVIAFEKERIRIAKVLRKEKEGEQRLIENKKSEAAAKLSIHEDSVDTTRISTESDLSIVSKPKLDAVTNKEIQQEPSMIEGEFSFEKLKIIEKAKGLPAAEPGYLKLVLQNNADAQERLGAINLEEELFVKAVTFYFLASKHKHKSVNEKMELAISKMTREEFEQAQKDIKEWLEKIKKHSEK
ncbi:MAG: sel1 repeat family protein [Candidatus Cloacimonetes bacterium]|nr:sel1 repeat family protein [Candidatus Cloacimonadota bacterium]